MTFESAQEMLDYIQDGHDLYSPSECIYIFLYNDDGSVCTYPIDYDEAVLLQNMAAEKGEYWGAFLGVGGSIYDDVSYYGYTPGEASNLDICKWFYKSDWLECGDVA